MPPLTPRPANPAIAAFLDQARAVAVRPAARGRLLFIMDATASRQPSWDRACHLMAEMFAATRAMGPQAAAGGQSQAAPGARSPAGSGAGSPAAPGARNPAAPGAQSPGAPGGEGGLAVQLAYWRGHMEFAATPFLADSAELTRRMAGVRCLGGQTQILRALLHALDETKRARVNACVLIGDALEEPLDPIAHAAGQLGLHGTPVFAFHEGEEPASAAGFRQIAQLSGGAFAPFDAGSADALRDLLRAVAVFAAGGRAGLAALPGPAARGIVAQLR